MTTIGLLKAGYFGTALAFEPEPDNFRLLVKKVQQNGLADQVRCFRTALSSDDGELLMELSKDNSGDHRVRQIETPGFFDEHKRRTIAVPAATLDGFFKRETDLATTLPDLLWVDIQGHEGQFFQGAQQLLAHGIPVISEFWPYGISRSGMSREEFADTLCTIFSSFYEVGAADCRKRPINEISQLFDSYPGPRNFGLLALTSDKRL